MARRKGEEVAPGTLRIATRPTEVALRRARHVQAALGALGHTSALVEFRSTGDKHREDQVPASAARDFFTDALENALRRKKADVAVHALSDLSTDPSPGLTIAAIPARDDPRDAIVINSLHEATSLDELPRGTRVGSSNVRIRSLLRGLYRHLEVAHLRGDLPERLRKVDNGQVHATVVPASTLTLLGLTQHIAGYLEPPVWLPAPGQGALALQTREDDPATREIMRSLDDADTHRRTIAERAVLHSLEGGLQSPVGALVIDDVLHAIIADLDGRVQLRASRPLASEDPELVGIRVANDLRAKGAIPILDEQRRAERVPAPQPD